MNERHAQPRNPGSRHGVSLLSLVAALFWVVVIVVSILSGALALLVTASLAQIAHEDSSHVALWMVAVLLTLGVPFALASWKHHSDTRALRASMAWLPAVWNVGGLMIASMLVPDLSGTALRSVEWVVEGRLGDSHKMTRVLSSLGHEAADQVDPDSPDAKNKIPSLSDKMRIAPGETIEVPLNEEGTTAIMLDVVLHGENDDIEGDYLFDTGASFTTITTKLAGRLGIDIPDDAPTLRFNTASGPRESKMVYLPALTLAGIRIPGLLVSVCDSCANANTQGLLGLNVMREFIVQMDYQDRNMKLMPRIHEGRPNRAYDIFPLVDMSIEGQPEIWLNRVRWVILVKNRGSQPIENVTPRVEFTDGMQLFGERIDRIESGQVGRSLVRGKINPVEPSTTGQGPTFSLTLLEGYW